MRKEFGVSAIGLGMAIVSFILATQVKTMPLFIAVLVGSAGVLLMVCGFACACLFRSREETPPS